MPEEKPHSSTMSSPWPALLLGVACVAGGTAGYVRTNSKPSLIAGLSVGILYLWAGAALRNGNTKGITGAMGASAILFLSSIPRVAKGPVPAMLTILSAASGYYYYPAFKALQS